VTDRAKLWKKVNEISQNKLVRSAPPNPLSGEHDNPKPQTTNTKPQTTNNEQRTTNNKQRTTNNEQQTTNNKQQTTNNEQQTTNNEQQTTNNNFLQQIKNKHKKKGIFMKRILLLLIFGIGIGLMGWGQQIIGTFPYMNGGFEGQATGALATTLHATNWTRQSQSGASSSIVTTSPRSGSQYATVTNVSTVSRGLQSPQLTPFVAGSTTTASTQYVVQFFVKNAATVASFQGGVTTNGTSNPAYSTAATLAINSSWTIQTLVLSTSATTVTSSGLAIIGRSSTGAFDVDDVVIYAGSSADATAPNSPGIVTVNGETQTSLDVSWVAASGGVDGGGYVVVRYATSPNDDNDLNQNGIYAVGNTTTIGTGGLTGTIRYVGTGASFTDNVGLSAGTQYWYKVYTADKAFNYSDESNGNGTTASATATPPTLTPDATNNNVDNDIDITFSDDATWRAEVTAVKIGGTALTLTTDYVFSEGNLQLKPSGLNALLTTSGSKSVTVEATGYSVASVTQVINAGADNKLEIITQPAAPVTNGAILGIQPVVAIRDQYGNATTSTASVVAAVGAGTWTLGDGSTSVAGISGTVTYSGLTATSAAAVTGANIDFTSTGLTHIVSNNFDIPAPLPQIDWANLQSPASGNINLGGTFDVYAQVYEPGVTDAVGQGSGIACWIGYSTSNTNPNTWTNWVAATYNSDNGNNDEYKANIGAVITPAGTYYYASRFQLGVAAFVYGGYNSGFWDGTTNVSGTLTINPPPQIDWANLQSPASGNINTGGTFNVYAQVYEADLTNPVGQGAGINAWIGYHTANTDPLTWTNWIVASYNTDAGNNDEYMANIATSLPAGTYYYASRFKYGLADYVYGGYSSGGGNFWDGTSYVSGVLTITTPEPTNYPTLFAAVANSSSQITITWTDATGGQTPDAYLVKAAVDPTTPTAPSDGTAEGDATLIKNIAQGTQQAVFTGLNSSTTYIFEIWPYKGTGSAINYKTDGTVPDANATTDAISLNTDYFRSKTSGNWNVAGTWESSADGNTWINSTLTPTTSANTVTILNGHVVTVSASVSVDQVVINSGGQITVNSGQTLTIANGTAATDMTVNGTLKSSGTLTNSGILSFGDGGKYQDNHTTNEALPLADWHTNSTLEMIGYTTNTSIPANTAQHFGNFVWNCTSQSANFQMASFSGDFRVTGSFKVLSTGSGSLRYTASSNKSLTVSSLVIEGGTFDLSSSSGIGTFIITGDFIMNGGTLTESGSASGVIQMGGASAQYINYSAGTVSNTVRFTIDGSDVILTGNTLILPNNLTINASKKLTIGSSNSLTVTGTLTNNATATGLVIESDATGTGSLKAENSVAATVQRYISASDDTPRPWHFVSSPVSGQTFISDVFNFVPETVATDFDFFYYGESTEATQRWINIRNADNTSYALWSSGNFEVGKGYLVNYDLSAYGTDHVFSGSLNNGTQSIPLTYTEAGAKGWNLIGNPYPASIDWSSVDRSSLADNFYYLYDPTENSGAGGYIYDDGTTENPRKYIAPQQGFFVKVSASGSLPLNNSKTVHQTTNFTKSANEDLSVFALKISNGTYTDETKVLLNPESQLVKDRHDAYKLYGFTAGLPYLYTLTSDGTKVAYNSIPEITSTDIRLGVVIPQAGQYTINLSAYQGYFEYVTLVLQDLLTGASQDLKQNPQYTFTGDPNGDANRFLIKFANVGIQNPAATDAGIYTYGNILNIINPGQATLEVYNMAGQRIFSDEINSNGLYQATIENRIGYYVVRLTNATQVKVSKVFIK